MTFDPTPLSGARAVDLPWATRADVTATEASAGSAAPTPAPAAPSAELDRDDTLDPQVAPRAAEGLPWGAVAAWGAGAAGLLALLAVPALARAAQRRRRLRLGSPGAVWDELLATAVDLGVPVRSTGTPRQLAADLADRVGADAAPAVRTLGLALQGDVYAPPVAASTADLVTPAKEVDRALRRSSPRRARLVARVLPPSLVADIRTRLSAHTRKPTPTAA